MRSLFVLFLAMLFLSKGFSDDKLAFLFIEDAESPLRIRELLPPNLIPCLPIDPCLPSDFIALTQDEVTYWGPKKVLETYLKDSRVLSEPIFGIEISPYISQDDLENPKLDQMKKDFQESGYKCFKETKLRLGGYPALMVQASSVKGNIALAWVGLNHVSRITLQFRLINPTVPFQLTSGGGKIWEDFFFKTQALEDFHLFMKAYGQNLKEGVTTFNKDAKLKFVAEQRERDRKLQLLVVPLEENVTFKFQRMQQDPLPFEWHKGEPGLKVYGIIEKDHPQWGGIIMEQAIIILIKQVQEFSIDEETAKSDPRIMVYSE